jgi:GT2 family glycosyltransferase/glycosyltransferase involved in cell wall biosynthesis
MNDEADRQDSDTGPSRPELERSLAEARAELKQTLEWLKELERTLDDIKSSASWKLARRLEWAGLWLAPPGSRRSEAVLQSYRSLTAIARMRNWHSLAHKLKTASSRARGNIRLLLRPWRILALKAVSPLRVPARPRTTPSALPTFENIDVSIVIPVFNHCSETVSCLESIGRCTSHPAYEVIVVDDGSTDETAEVLSQIAGLVLLRNDRNLGFVGSCNRGAGRARGRFLLFLNNDTVVTPGWLEALARTFQDIPGTGIAGAKLVYPDGRLQEAGGVIWRDGSGSNLGKFDDPDHPRYNFAREVDFCSGACLMVPRALFDRLGGFDTFYSPAYYEDTDLAFRVRHAGHKVIYQPLAQVVHHEGMTAGRSVRSGAKSHQLVNRAKFRHRWRTTLASQPDSSQGHAKAIRHREIDARPPGRVLVIDHRLPTPDRDAGSARMTEIIRAILRDCHHVTFIPDDLSLREPYHQLLQGIGVKIVHHPYYRSVASYLKQHGSEYHLALISRLVIASRHLATVRRYASQAKVVFDTVDLHFLREEREAALKHDRETKDEIARRKQQEIHLARLADATLVVSPVEKSILEKECPGIEVRIIPTIYNVPQTDPPGMERRCKIVFIGGFEHPPNRDAVLYFAREILPLIRSQVPDAVFQVIGSDPPPQVLDLASEEIEVLGYIPDVAPYFDRARVAVAPLRYGAGVKGKVNQSMSLGVPTVVTPIAAEGMYLVHGENALIAEDERSFADAVVRLWGSPELWRRISVNGRRNVREHFSVETAARGVNELLEWAGLSRPVPAASRSERVKVG